MTMRRKSIAFTSFFLMLLTIIASISSFGKEAVIAAYFGASVESDAYNLASQIPVVLYSVLSVSIRTIVIPLYSKKKYGKNSKESSDLFASNIYNFVILIGIFAMIGFLIFAEQIVFLFAPGASVETREIATKMVRIIAPIIISSSSFDVVTGIMNVNHSFVVPETISIIRTWFQIFFIIICSTTFGIFSAAYGLFIGAIFQFLSSYFFFRKYVKHTLFLDLYDPEIRVAAKQSVPIFAGLGISELNKLIDKVISSFLAVGSITALSYASKITSVVSTFFVQSISTVMFPVLAEKVAIKDDDAVNDNYITSIILYHIILLPSIIGLYILRNEIIELVFERGKFNSESALITAQVFGFYAFAMLFSAFRTATAKVFYAYGDTRTPMLNAAIGAVINIVLNLILVQPLGPSGLALATSISSLCISALMMTSLKRKHKFIVFTRYWPECIRSIISSIIMLISLVFIYFYSQQFTVYFRVSICVLVGCLTYYFSLIIMGSPTTKKITYSIIKRFVKK